MAVLPVSNDIFAPVPSTGASKKIPSPSQSTVAAIAAGRAPAAATKPALRRLSSASSAAVNRKANPQKRANHNAVERARRDSLNQRFLVLASKLPAISAVRRPSKSLIVNRSLQFVNDSLSREAMYRKMLTDLHDRTRVLTEQLNEYRLANGLENYVEQVPELNLPIALADVPKDKPSARVLNRKDSSSAAEIDGTDGEDELDDGAFSLDQFTDEPAPIQSGIQMSLPTPSMPYSVPIQVPTDASYFSHPMTSPTAAASSPGAHTEPPALSPMSAPSPIVEPPFMVHPMISPAAPTNSAVNAYPMYDTSLFEPNHFAGDFSSFLSANAFASS